MEIGRSYAGITLLLERLSGRHVHGKADKIGAIVLGLFLIGCAAWLSTARGERSVVMIVPVILLLVAVGTVAQSWAELTISPQGIQKRLPVLGTIWRVASADIYSIALLYDKGWRLHVKTTGDRTRSIAVISSLRAALTTIYPEIGTGEWHPLPTKLRYAGYALLALLVIGLAITVWVLASRGLISW